MKNPQSVTVYIDSEYKCHISEGEGRRAVDVFGFAGKCEEYIEGFRYIPEGERWTRGDGTEFTGEMLAPWKTYAELDAAQRLYEQQEAQDMKEALALLGVTIDD